VQGPVWVFDITGVSGVPSCHWSPLASIRSYADAVKAAAWLSESSKVESKGLGDQRFWDMLGEKLLAPLLFAAARTGRHIASVVRWVDLAAEDEVQEILDELGDPDAIAAWSAACSQPDRTKGSVFGTAEVVLQPFSHPEVRTTLSVDGPGEVFSTGRLLDTGGTLYLVAPAHDQELFTPVFETLTNAVSARWSCARRATGACRWTRRCCCAWTRPPTAPRCGAWIGSLSSVGLTRSGWMRPQRVCHAWMISSARRTTGGSTIEPSTTTAPALLFAADVTFRAQSISFGVGRNDVLTEST
jgi:hypothetical protein